ncbi:MAG TPA: dihydrofolate reductase [Bacteroidales bacterium]|nr:dihydrofolate reductase [Bacteroidales bacterium]
MKSISIIVALANDNGIGKDNKLLCHIPGDLKRFRQITTGHTVIMGKNTFFSLPGGPLKDRRNIVISDNLNDHFEGCETVYSLNEAIEKCDDCQENFVIGGASIYRQFLPFATKLYLTLVDKSFEADTFFPGVNPEDWEEISRDNKQAGDPADFSYAYVILQRKI